MVLPNKTAESPVREEAPIPTSFNNSPTSNVKTTFGTGKRGDIVASFTTPAPNLYQSPLAPNNKAKKTKKGKKRYADACTFGAKTQKFVEPNYNPGPGTYFPEIKRNSSPIVSIGTAVRQSMQLPVYTEKYYNPPNVFPAQLVSFGNEKKDVEIKKTKLPGPGTYDVRGIFGELPEYALKSANANNKSP